MKGLSNTGMTTQEAIKAIRMLGSLGIGPKSILTEDDAEAMSLEAIWENIEAELEQERRAAYWLELVKEDVDNIDL